MIDEDEKCQHLDVEIVEAGDAYPGSLPFPMCYEGCKLTKEDIETIMSRGEPEYHNDEDL